MNTRFGKPMVFIGIIAVLLILAVVGTIAMAQEGNGSSSSSDMPVGRDVGANSVGMQPGRTRIPEQDAPQGTSYLQVAGAAMRPESSDLVEWKVNPTYLGCIYASSGDPNQWWNAPVFPPQGATISMVRVYWFDGSSSYEGRVGFGVVDGTGYVVHSWLENSSGNSGNGYVDIPLPNHVVDYSNYSYIVWWRPNLLGDTMEICGFRLYYTTPGGVQYLPSILK